MTRRNRTCLAAALCVALMLPGGVRAGVIEGWGPRAGFSARPDQFVVGLHVDLRPLAKNLRLRPNIDVGLGENATMITLNPDLVYAVPIEGAGAFLFGGTLSLVHANTDASRTYKDGSGNEHVLTVDNDTTELGVAACAGFRFSTSDPIFIDAKFGIADKYPDLKVVVGFSFLK